MDGRRLDQQRLRASSSRGGSPRRALATGNREARLPAFPCEVRQRRTRASRCHLRSPRGRSLSYLPAGARIFRASWWKSVRFVSIVCSLRRVAISNTVASGTVRDVSPKLEDDGRHDRDCRKSGSPQALPSRSWGHRPRPERAGRAPRRFPSFRPVFTLRLGPGAA